MKRDINLADAVEMAKKQLHLGVQVSSIHENKIALFKTVFGWLLRVSATHETRRVVVG